MAFLAVLVFLFSPKTVGTALGALDIQTPGLRNLASSAGAFCVLAILACWLVVLGRGAWLSVLPQVCRDGAPIGTFTGT